VPYLVDSTNIPTLQPGRKGICWQVDRLRGRARRERDPDRASRQESELVMLDAGKHATNLLDEGSRPEWLGEHGTGDIPVSAEAGDKQYGRWRLEAGEVVGEFQAIHPGHPNVGHDKAESPIQSAGDGEGLFAVLGRQDSEALLDQHPRQKFAEHCVVVYDQYHLLTRLSGVVPPIEVLQDGVRHKACQPAGLPQTSVTSKLAFWSRGMMRLSSARRSSAVGIGTSSIQVDTWTACAVYLC
jgi:hypothetical protein